MPNDLEPFIYLAPLLLIAGYLALVCRRRQRYLSRVAFDAPAEAVWKVMHLWPGEPIWHPGVTAVEWVEAPGGDVRVSFAGGAEMITRVTSSDEPRALEALHVYRWPGSEAYGDVITSRAALAETGGRTTLAVEYLIDRAGLLNGFLARLTYPFMLRLFAQAARPELLRRHAEAGRGPWGAPQVAVPPKPAWRRLLDARALLAAGTVLWLSYAMGIGLGIALAVGIVIHEYGHLFAMRRHGHETAKFFLVPFLGGLAVSPRAPRSDAEAAEVALMGPVFGLAPGLLAVLLHHATGEVWLSAAALLLILFNLFNLAPFPPLDGGQVAQNLLRPLGPKAWSVVSVALVLAGAALSVSFRSNLMLVVFVVGALAWAAAPLPSPERAALTGRGWAAVTASYVALVGAHLAALAALGLSTDWRRTFEIFG